MYCLGCMAILVVVAIGIGIFGYVKVRNAMTPITAANVKTMLPPGVPLYPGLSPVLEKQSRSIQLPSKTGTHRMVVLSFNTTDGMSVIGPWYQAQLTPKGWMGGVSPTNANVYQFKKTDTALSLTGQAGSGGRNVLIMSIVTGVPTGSVGMPTAP